MNEEKLRDLFLNWKGLELTYSLKSIFKWAIIVLSILFIFISIKIQNYYIMGASLILIFLQVLSENNKEYYLKYKEIFEESIKGKETEEHKNWINFLEKTSGLNSVYKWFFGLIFNKEFKKLLEKEEASTPHRT